MTRPDRSSSEDLPLGLAPEDARLVERLRHGFAPESEDAVRAAAFDAALRERIESDSRPRARWAPALAGAALVVAVWLGLRSVAPQPADQSEVPIAQAPASQDARPLRIAEAPRAEALAWEESLFFPSAFGGEQDELPGEYQAIATVFLDDAL